MTKNKFSISISYPSFESSKGTPFLSQNRQFQWTHTGNVIYPVIPATAATLLKQNGYKVFWDDAIAQKLNYQQWFNKLKKNKPNLIVIESKTPVIKQHWKIINQIKKIKGWKPIIVLMGDHVTALPEESLKNSKVDYILTGGDYDFMLLNLVDHLTKKTPLEPGFYFRQTSGSGFETSGKFALKHHNLDSLPIIDRKLTQWQLYAYNNTNYKYKPGAYIMSGRDCWWGKCAFCVTGETKINTKEGLLTIKDIVDNEIPCEVLTDKLSYQKVTDWQKRLVNENIINISSLYLPSSLKITSNHKLFCLPKKSIHKCTRKCGGSYECRPSRISNFTKCYSCLKKYYQDYTIDSVEAGNLKVGDFLTIPIDRSIKDVNKLNIEDIIKKQPIVFTTHKKISNEKIEESINLKNQKKSERAISQLMSIDRETVHRYLSLYKKGEITESINHLSYNNNDEISFFGGKHKIPKSITINDDFLFFAGLYIAEGHTTFNKNRPNSAVTGLTFNMKETDFINATKQAFINFFKVVPSETINKTNHTHQLIASSTIIAKSFKILFGSNCYQKKIPSEFIYLPIEKQRFLLKGIFGGDGHLRPESKRRGGKEYILETTSLTLANQVFNMLLRFDVLPSYKTIPPRLENESIKYKITLFRQDILKVFPDIKFFDNPKLTYKRGFILNNFAFVPIVKIVKEPFKGYVYNLTVDKDHSYTANFTTVKNCSWTTLYPGNNFRCFSVKHTIAEIENLIYNFGVKEIFDDSGTLPVGPWLKELCQELIKRGLNKKVKIGCNMRFGALNQDQYNLMKQAGFRFILYGLESANQETLEKINKNNLVKNVLPTLKMVQKAKLEPHITIMIGYPWETKKDTLKTINFAKQIFKQGLTNSMQATIIIPYPGTPLFAECQKSNLLETSNWDDYDMQHKIMSSSLSEVELKKLTQNLFKGIITPKFIFKQIISVRSIEDIRHLGNYAVKFIQKLKDFSANDN